MSQYRDPYSEQQQDSHNQQYGDASYDTRQPHQAYDQGGYDPHTMGEYRDDPNANPQAAAASYAPAAQEMNPYEQPNYAKKKWTPISGFQDLER